MPDLDIMDTAATYTASKQILEQKYNDAITWAQLADGKLSQNIADINNLLGADVVGNNLSAIEAAVDGIDLYIPPTGDFTYTSPTAPGYDTVPAYAEQTLGAMEAIPAVDAITIGAAPSTAVSFTNSGFTDTLLGTLRDKLAADIVGAHTGLGAAEAALFARETARQNAARSAAYTEVTTQFSARGFDMPPGALLAKQTEINNESTIRLSDSSSQIMAESARLAVDYNKTVLSQSTGLLDLLSRVFDSQIMRDFEAAKATVQYAIEGFKQIVSVALAKAELNKTAIAAAVAANEGTVKVFQARIEGQVAPMKAIAETNQAKASAYNAAVAAEKGNLEAQTIPEELKLKGAGVNAQIAGTKAEIVFKEASLAIETAARQLQLEVTTIAGMAQSAAQMVAAALNGVSVSSSFGWSGSMRPFDPDLDDKIASQEKIAAMNLVPPSWP